MNQNEIDGMKKGADFGFREFRLSITIAFIFGRLLSNLKQG